MGIKEKKEEERDAEMRECPFSIVWFCWISDAGRACSTKSARFGQQLRQLEEMSQSREVKTLKFSTISTLKI